MKPGMLDAPRNHFDGLGMLAESSTVTHAYQLLMDWPADLMIQSALAFYQVKLRANGL